MIAASTARPSRRRATSPPLVAALALALSSCASQGAPPGGPPDTQPPKLVRIVPDTGAVNVKAPRALFEFDETVSERPQGSGATSLQGMFLVSPREGEPDVDWGRRVISVRPHRGFRPNTVYTITLLPGLTDLRGNVSKEGATAVFSTGATIPATTVRGIVFDWVAGQPAPRAVVEAIVPLPAADTGARRARRDSVVYVTSADSSGRFTFAHLPPGPYVVRGFVDANNNRGLDSREAWDSVRVALADSARVELLTFVHDTLGPGIATITQSDSVTLRVAFDNPLSPAIRPESATYVLRASDSTLVPIAFVRAARDSSLAMTLPYSPPGVARPTTPAPRDTTAPPVPAAPPPTRTPPREQKKPAARPTPPPAQRPRGRRPTAAEMRAIADSAARADSLARVAARADSIARADSAARAAAAPAIPPTAVPARRDTTPPPPPAARPSRQPPVTEVVITLTKPLKPNTTYRLEVRGARGILGRERASNRTFTTPKEGTPPPAGAADSSAARRDSTRRDSTRAVPPRRPPER